MGKLHQTPADLIDDYKHKGQRRRLVEKLATRGITDERVLAAMGGVPRHFFVPVGLEAEAYADKALPIEVGQTISQPFTVAFQSELLQAKPKMKVLEIGTGSGYQAAVLARLGAEVYSVERIGGLAESAGRRLQALGYERIEVRHGDGARGWPEKAPFERIIVTAALRREPEALFGQLSAPGRMIYPLGGRRMQRLVLVERKSSGSYRRQDLLPVRFVPFREGTA